MGAAGGQGAAGPTGRPRAHTSARASARAGRCVGSPTCGSALRSPENLLGGRRAKGSGSGGGLEAGAGTSAPAQMSAAARAGVPTAKAHPGSQGLPRTYTSPRCRSQTWLCHLLIAPLAGPHPALHSTRARSRASYRHSLASNLCSGQDVSAVLSFPSQCQPHEVFSHLGHPQSLKPEGNGHLPSAARKGQQLEELCVEY